MGPSLLSAYAGLYLSGQGSEQWEPVLLVPATSQWRCCGRTPADMNDIDSLGIAM